ncbi:MAG: hypothetical protein P1V35_03385 [Planctomycetota bacterium]|nr:hypothetical protein [Planctomycetota bacterium]
MRCLILLLSVLLLTPLAAAGDPMVAKAVARIAKVETAESNLPAGDHKAGAKLLSDLNWAQKRLNAVVQQGTQEWKNANARLKAARASVTAKLNQPKPKPGPDPKPAPGVDPKPKPAPKPAPAPAYEHAKLVALNKDIGNAWNNLKVVPLRLMKDANRVAGVRREIEGFRSRLAQYPAGDSNVKLVTANLNDFEALLKDGLARLAEDQGQVPDIEARIEGMRKKYDRETMPQALKPPFTKGQVEAWAQNVLRVRDKELPEDIAWLAQMEPNAALKQNLASGQRMYLETSIKSRIHGVEKAVREALSSPVEEQLRYGKWILETDPKDPHHVRNRILGRGALDENMLRLQQGLQAIDLAETYDRSMGEACVLGPTITGDMPRPAFPDRAAQRKQVQDAIAHLKRCAVAALDSMRMPAADSNDPELIKIATDLLKAPKNNVAGWERLVINRGLKHHEQRRGWIEPGSLNSLDLTMYSYAWDDFIVTTAERRGDEVWLFSNKFENYSSGDKRTTTGKWYLASRHELTRILPGNVGKPPLPEAGASK